MVVVEMPASDWPTFGQPEFLKRRHPLIEEAANCARMQPRAAIGGLCRATPVWGYIHAAYSNGWAWLPRAPAATHHDAAGEQPD